MKYLIDSDIIINYLKGKSPAIALFQNLSVANLGVSVITVAEVLEGVSASPKRLEEAERVLSHFIIFNMDMKIAKEFAIQRLRLRKAGNLIDNMDLFIASTALAHNLTLITGNIKDFEKIKDLKILDR